MMLLSEEITAQVQDVAERYMAVSDEVDLEQWRSRPLRTKALENVCRLTSALL